MADDRAADDWTDVRREQLAPADGQAARNWTPTEIATAIEQLRRCREIGVSHLISEAFSADLDNLKSLTDVLANQVRPKALA